jgi:hypothetical protein
MVSIVLFATGILCSVLYWFTAVSPGFKQRIGAFGAFGAVCFIAAVLVGMLAISARRRGKYKLLIYGLELATLLSGAGIFLSMNWLVPAALFGLLAVVSLAAGLLEGRIASAATVTVDEKGVHRPFANNRRHTPWHEVKQVLLRRGVLTIDCTDNRLYQYTVGTTDLDIASFEQYCAQQVTEGMSKRPKNDW